MSSKHFKEMLTGGHPNFLGRTVEVVELVLSDKQKLADLFDCYSSDDDVVRLRVSSAFKRILRENNDWFVDYIDKALNRIYYKHIEFEKGRLTSSPTRSNARYSLSKPITIDNLQTAFALYDLIEEAEHKGKKVNNYNLVKQVGIEVGQRNTAEEWHVAYKRRVVSVAVTRKKKVAVDAMRNVAEGKFG